ncbi:hypothetical protein AVEN_246702-1 [Araneus ventricosus]|uniref:Uncharacterized protein n=1 Tax=Araneus ventricosus TaxID=182803 RepID=A0A4Y2U160_ARAVE|nr:hypothetical protein AVEN_246702-1 [Araneus ventricosus]
MNQHYYRSASNEAFTAQRLELQRRSRSKAIPVDQHCLRRPSALLIVSRQGRDVTWNHLCHSSVFSTIEISIRFQHLRSHISSPRSGSRPAAAVISYLPL